MNELEGGGREMQVGLSQYKSVRLIYLYLWRSPLLKYDGPKEKGNKPKKKKKKRKKEKRKKGLTRQQRPLSIASPPRRPWLSDGATCMQQ